MSDSPQDEVMELIQPPAAEEVEAEQAPTAEVVEEDQALEVDEDALDPQQDEEIDKKSPAYIAGKKAMQTMMQNSFDKRVNKEVGKRKLMENNVNQLRGDFDELKKSLIKAPVAPKFEDFAEQDNPTEEFVEAAFKHHATASPGSNPVSPVVQSTVVSQEESDFAEQEAAYASVNPSYYADIQNLKGYMNKDLKAVIFDASPDVSHVLSYNLDVVERISKMKPSQMGREIAKIEMNIKKGKPIPKRAKPKPEPITESRGSAGGNKNLGDCLSQSAHNKMMSEL